MRFIVANYGMRHVGMLLAHVYSVMRTHSDAAITVYWQDIPEELVEVVRAIAPQATFIRTEFDFAKDPLQRISSKVLCWSRAAEEYEGETELVFCDSDTLVRRDLQCFFKSGDEHVIVTAKPESVPLNSGVILARGGPATTAFFRAWRAETLHILRTPDLFAQANDPSQPFGGPDQMSMYRILSYRAETSQYTVRCGDYEVRLRAEPCAKLNETNSRALSDEIHVVHYKAGWQRILLDGRPFSRFRPRAKSWQMLDFFLTTFADALRRANEITGRRRTAADFGIRWPWYYTAGQFNAPAYAAWRLKEAAKRGWLLATGRLKPGM